MGEPSAEAIRRAREIAGTAMSGHACARNVLVARFVASGLDDLLFSEVDEEALIRAIAAALDDLAGATKVLIEGIRNGETADSETMRTRLSLASGAVWRFEGMPPGRLPPVRRQGQA